MTVFVVTMTTALLLVAGLVFDGGRMIAARRDADAVSVNPVPGAHFMALDLPTPRAQA